jgi:hypothetical protein
MSPEKKVQQYGQKRNFVGKGPTKAVESRASEQRKQNGGGLKVMHADATKRNGY